MTRTSSEITISPLSPGDLDAVVAIDRAASGRSRRGYFQKRLAAAIERPADYVFAGAFDGAALAGFALAKIETGAFGQTGASASLDAIGVTADHAQHGLGLRLLDEVQAVLAHKGVTALSSQVGWSQIPMLGFFAHAGFALAPRMVLTRTTEALKLELDEIEDHPDHEPDYSAPDGDAANALSRDRVPVRSMQDADLARIIRMDRAHTGVDRTDYYSRRLRENLHESGIRVSLVAEQDGFPVGFIMARVDFGEFGHTGPEAVMDALGIDPGYRGQGIGRVMMARLMDNLAALEVETVRTEVDWDDTDLIAFFSRSGFTPAQRIALAKRW